VKRQAGDGGEKYKKKSTYRGGEIVAGVRFPVTSEIETEVYRVLRDEWGGTVEIEKGQVKAGRQYKSRIHTLYPGLEIACACPR
jgi:hypothetical protein